MTKEEHEAITGPLAARCVELLRQEERNRAALAVRRVREIEKALNDANSIATELQKELDEKVALLKKGTDTVEALDKVIAVATRVGPALLKIATLVSGALS